VGSWVTGIPNTFPRSCKHRSLTTSITTWMSTECSLNVHWMFTKCSPSVHQLFSNCSLSVPWMFPECSLYVYRMLTECSLDVLRMVTECSPNVHQMFTKCSPYFPLMFTAWVGLGSAGNGCAVWMFPYCSHKMNRVLERYRDHYIFPRACKQCSITT
jgi:hypothetical protein